MCVYIHIYIYITVSLCCTLETNTACKLAIGNRKSLLENDQRKPNILSGEGERSGGKPPIQRELYTQMYQSRRKYPVIKQ